MSYSESERRLTNDDFRKLFMTPRHPGSSDPSASKQKQDADNFVAPATPSSSTPGSVRKDKGRQDDKRQQQKKKHFYQKTKSEEEETLAELAKKYRDRAKERRDGHNPEAQREELITNQGAYRAVAPDFRGNVDAAERRKQLIQESKFLGGDMEHTHLVKGLDYALLQKVRSEIDTKGDEEGDEEVEEEVKPEVKKSTAEPPAPAPAPAPPKKPTGGVPEPDSGFRTKLARNVHRALFQTSLPERNELFAPGRMAYVFDLEDEYAESDIPTTVIRSKADVPLTEGQATLTTNDIVINKLAQILSYLRQGSKSSKKLKKNKDLKVGKFDEREHKKPPEEDSIYGEIGDYVPNLKSKSRSSEKDRSMKRQPYFEKPADEDDREIVLEQKSGAIEPIEPRKRDREAWSEEAHGGDQTFGSILKKAEEKSLSRTQKLLSKINEQPEGYAECYPGFDEMHDAIDDSDEETDYSKMDPGKKKGTVGRWDFDTMEEYSEYMSNKEALPKAAFQFGVKMGDGRKTRKGAKSEKNEKQQLDRQWQQIQAILAKRKAAGGGDGEPEPKTPRV